jgi:hypothetical protein
MKKGIGCGVGSGSISQRGTDSGIRIRIRTKCHGPQHYKKMCKREEKKSTLWRDLTKVISILKLEVPRLTCLKPGIEPGPPWVEGMHSSKDQFEQRINNYSEHQHTV